MDFNLFSKHKEQISDRKDNQKESVWQNMKAGISYLKLQPIIMLLVWISLIINFLFGAFEVGYSFILIEKLKINSEHFGFTQGAFAVGMLLLSIYFSARKEVRYPMLVSKWGILFMGAVMGAVSIPLLITFSYIGNFLYYIILMFTFGSLVIIVNTPIQVMLQKKIDDEYKGRVFSIIETMAMALMPLGMVLFGLLYDVLPAQWILISSATLLITIVLILARPSVVRRAHPELEKKHGKPTEVEMPL